MPFAEGRWHTKATHEVPLSERKNARQSRRSKWKLLGPYWDGGLGEKNERPERREGGTVAGKGVANDVGLVTNSAHTEPLGPLLTGVLSSKRVLRGGPKGT